MTAQVEQTIESTLGKMGTAADLAQDAGAPKPKWKQELESELSWDKLKGNYERAYAEVLTPKEIQELIAGYQTPTGQLLLDKAPILMRDNLDLMQRKQMEMMQDVIKAKTGTGSLQPEGGASPAPEAPLRTDIEELLVVSELQKTYEHSLAPYKAQLERLSKATGPGAVSPDTVKAMESILSWESMKREYAWIYGDVFTFSEIQQLIAFYKTPAGQIVAEKAPLLLEKTAGSTQEATTRLVPLLEKAAMDDYQKPFSAFNGETGSAPATAALSGTYVLMERPADGEAIDRIVFNKDWSCRFDIDDRKDVAGKYQITQKGNSTHITLEPGPASPSVTYDLTRLDLSVWLMPGDGSMSLVYGLMPREPAKVTFGDVVGRFASRDSVSDEVTEITADHQYKCSGWFLDSEAHTYQNFEIDGTCAYANGVITYFPVHSDISQKDKYSSDIVLKRDSSGLWVVVATDNNIVCETPTGSFDVPPPPLGYKAAAK